MKQGGIKMAKTKYMMKHIAIVLAVFAAVFFYGGL